MDLTGDETTDDTNERLPPELQTSLLSHQDNLIGFLGLMQYFEVPVKAITWQPGLDQLGTGGTASVTQAAVSAKTSYAFKRMRQEKHLDKWVNEVMILGQLHNRPHVSSIEACCLEILTDGKLFPVLVFKKADFGDLDSFMASKRGLALQDEDTLRLCRDIGLGLSHIHDSNVIHGDVKPSNILVYRGTNEEIVPKIADFGHSSLRHTDDALVKLPFSPFFNAPDYHERYFHLRDAKKFDVYNFGLIVYWLLVGRKMRQEEVSFLRSIQFRQDTILVANSVIDERDLREDQKADLQAFFKATLSDHYQERSTDWDYLLSLLREDALRSMSPRLEGHAAGHGIAEHLSQHKASEADSHPKFTLRHHIAYLADADPHIRNSLLRGLHDSYRTRRCDECERHNAFQVALSAFIGFGQPYNSYNYKDELKKSGHSLLKLQEEVHLIREMWRESDVDEGTNEAAENLFTDDLSLNYRNMPHMDLDSIIRLHTDEIASCKSVLGDRHGVTIALSRSFAKVLKSRSCYREALAVLAETFSSVNHVPTACKIELEMALLNRHLGNKVLAEKQAAEVVTNLEHMFGPKHSFTLSAGSCLASIWNDLGRLDDAETLLHRLLLDKTERFGPEHPSTVKTSGTLAAVYYNKKRYTEAESLQIEILRHCERSFGSDHEFTWARRLNLAAIYTKLNRFEEAERIESQVLEYRRIKLGPKHDLYLTALSNLAFTYRLQKEWTKEETALCEVVSGRLEVLGSGHSDTMTSVQALANNCLSRRAPTQAAPLFQKLVEVKSQKSDLGPTHPSTLASRNSLAWAYFDQGKQVEARSMQRQTVEDGDIALGLSHPAAIHCKRHYAMMLKASGRLEDSMQIFREVLHVQVQGQGDPVVNDMQDTLRRISELEGLIEKAEDVQ